MASPVYSTLSDSILRDNSLSRSPHTPGHTPSPRKLKKLQSATSSGELHSDSKCKRCGWRYPNPNPHYRQRRDHKKICPNRPPLGSAEDIGRSGDYGISGDYGDFARSESGDTGLTGDHDLTDTAKSSRKTLSFGEFEQEKATEQTQKQTEREVQNELEHGLSEEPENAGEKSKAGSSEKPESAGDKSKAGSSEKPESAGDKFKAGFREEPESPGDNFKAGSSEEPESVGDKFKAGFSSVPIHSGEKSDGAGNGKAELFQGKELDLQHVPEDVHQDTHFPRSESGLETGSDSEVSSEAGEHETDPSEDMEFESSDIGEAGKREESYPSDDEIPQEETKDGTLQLQHPQAHAQVKGGPEGSHAGENRTDSEGEGKAINVANLITKYEKRSPTSLPSDVTSDYSALAGNKRSLPFVKTGETQQLSLRSKDGRNVGEITPAEEILDEGRLSTASGGDYDLEYILKKQKTHDLICPICGSQITNRIVLRKKRRAFVSKDESRLPEITTDTSNQDQDVKALTDRPGSHGETWVQRCFGYFGLFSTNS